MPVSTAQIDKRIEKLAVRIAKLEELKRELADLKALRGRVEKLEKIVNRGPRKK